MRIGVFFVSTSDEHTNRPLATLARWIEQAGIRSVLLQLPAHSSTDAAHARVLIARGVREIVLRTDGRDILPQTILHELTRPHGSGDSWARVIQDYPEVAWWLEVGNEPDIDFGPGYRPVDPETWRRQLLAVPQQIGDDLRALGLRTIAALPTNVADSRVVLRGGEVGAAYDAVAVHVYGHRTMGDNPPHMDNLLLAEKDPSVKRIVLTEVGINDPDSPIVERMRRIRSWADASRWRAEVAIVFCTGTKDWRNYLLDSAEAFQALGTRSEASMGIERYRIRGLVDRRAELQRNPNGGPRRSVPLARKRGVIVHYNGGPVLNYHDSEAAWRVVQASAVDHCTRNWGMSDQQPIYGDGLQYHIVVGPNGERWLTRDLEAVLWHCGSWPENETHIAVQCPLGGDQRATRAQLQALREVVDDLLKLTGAPRAEVKGHQEVSPTSCPGTLMQDFVLPYRQGEKQPMADGMRFPETGRYLGGGFYRYWLENGGLAVFGYPVTEEIQEVVSGCGCRLDGKPHTVQYFERAVFEWHPGKWPERYDVLLRRLGAEAAKRAGYSGPGIG